MGRIRKVDKQGTRDIGNEGQQCSGEVSVADQDWEPNHSLGFAETHGYVKTMWLHLEAFKLNGTRQDLSEPLQLTNPPVTRLELKIFYGDVPDIDRWGEAPLFLSNITGIMTKDIQPILDDLEGKEDAMVQLVPSWVLIGALDD